MKRAKAFLMALLVALFSPSCSRPPTSPSNTVGPNLLAREVGSRPKHSVHGSPAITAIVRGFIESRSQPPPDYGFYVYLYFAERSQRTAAVRSSAADAFLALFQNAIDAQRLNIPAHQLAFMYAPMTSASQPTSAAEMLERYDYLAAQSMARALAPKVTLPRVALIGAAHRPPWSSHQAGEMMLVDLCTRDVEATILAFRTRLVYPESRLKEDGFILAAMRAFFAELGGAALTVFGKTAQAAGEGPCGAG